MDRSRLRGLCTLADALHRTDGPRRVATELLHEPGVESRKKMRLQPIEKPKRLMMRIAYFMTRRQLGKVMTPMKVVLARMPGSEKFSWRSPSSS